MRFPLKIVDTQMTEEIIISIQTERFIICFMLKYCTNITMYKYKQIMEIECHNFQCL